MHYVVVDEVRNAGDRDRTARIAQSRGEGLEKKRPPHRSGAVDGQTEFGIASSAAVVRTR